VVAGDGALAGQRICLDPGHGGSDPGAVNEAYDLHEAEINLDIAFYLQTLFEGEGAAVAMTRTEDVDKSNRDRYTYCNNVGADLLISVHTNSSTDPAIDGAMQLYFHSQDEVLVRAIHRVLYPALKADVPGTFTDFGLEKFASGVLLKSDMPSVIVEPVLMSNAWEAEQLLTTIGSCVDASCRRKQIGQAVFEGVLAYYAGSAPSPTPTPSPEPGGTMHVAAIDVVGSTRGRNVFVTTEVAIADANDAPVGNAEVTLEIAQPDGSVVTEYGTTDESGVASVKIRTSQTGTYVSTVIQVARSGWVYDAAANVETSESALIP
jgi:N-acetylmuramoyl-L-alanine amidase